MSSSILHQTQPAEGREQHVLLDQTRAPTRPTLNIYRDPFPKDTRVPLPILHRDPVPTHMDPLPILHRYPVPIQTTWGEASRKDHTHMHWIMLVSSPVLVVQLVTNLLPHLAEGVQTVVDLLQVPVLVMHDLLQGHSDRAIGNKQHLDMNTHTCTHTHTHTHAHMHTHTHTHTHMYEHA